MSVRVDDVTAGDGVMVVSWVVLGDPGEGYDCEGLELGRFELRFAPVTAVDRMVAALRIRAAEVYLDGYQAWVVRNRLAAAISESGG